MLETLEVQEEPGWLSEDEIRAVEVWPLSGGLVALELAPWTDQEDAELEVAQLVSVVRPLAAARSLRAVLLVHPNSPLRGEQVVLERVLEGVTPE